MDWAAGFTYLHFKLLLVAVKSLFEFQMFSKAPEVMKSLSPNTIFLRHDVDLCLEKAVCMAQVENSVGVRATYMVSVNSPLYSLERESQLKIVKKIIELGHDIGLHHIVDGKSNDNGSIDQLDTGLSCARQELERLIDRPVNSFSFHRPTPVVLGGPLVINGMVNAYSADLMTCYLSDSAGSWKGRDPLAHLLSSHSRRLQLLVHPLWWGEDHMNPEDRLQEFFAIRTKGLPMEEVEAFDSILLNTLGRVRRRGLNGWPVEIDNVSQIMARASVARP
jgi:hypothetical protein